jgi:hypothetical protein
VAASGDLEIDLPEKTDGTDRKRASQDDGQAVVQAAITDPEANDGAVTSATFSVVEDEPESSAASRMASPLSYLF